MMPNSCPSLKVLCVDDSKSDLLLSERVLTTKGFDVITAMEGETAIELIKEHSFDIAVLDYQMPRTNGLELARQIRQIRGELPIILYSGAVPSEAKGSIWIDCAVDKNDGCNGLLRAIHDVMKKQ